MKLLIVFAVLLKSFVFCKINNEIVNKEAESCGGICDKTYPLHTYPSAEHPGACKRGCRLFAVLHVLGESNGINGTRESCISSCTEAYSNTALRYACNMGCNSQQGDGDDVVNQEDDYAHLLKPLVYVQVVYSNLAGHVKQFVSHSWTVYMRQGKLIEGKDRPQLLQEMESEDDGLSESHEMDLSDDKFDFGTEEIHHIPFTVVRGGLMRPSMHRQEYVHIQSVDSGVSLDWLSCISRQSGLPRRLLLLVLMLAVVVMVWLCCATAATAPEQRIKSQNVEYYNDLTYLLACSQAEKVKIQPPCDILAPPLPVKVKLHDNLV